MYLHVPVKWPFFVVICKNSTKTESNIGKRDQKANSAKKPDGSRLLALTIDSIDHSKFAVPRSPSMSSKAFGQFIRPCLGVTMAICHGHCALVFVSEPHLSHDSSWTAELIAITLNVLAKEFSYIDYRSAHLSLHGDNSTKELKNNSVLRMLSATVSSRRLKSASLNTLMSGHSHEDIDQSFSSLAAWIHSQGDLHTTNQFVDSIQAWLDQPQIRPDEPFKKVYRIDQVRAWILECFCLISIFLCVAWTTLEILVSKCKWTWWKESILHGGKSHEIWP